MKGRLLKGAMWTSIGRVVSVGSLFASVLVLGRILPKVELGDYWIAVATYTFMLMLVSLGTAPIVGRIVRQTVYGENSGQTKQIIFACLKLVLCSAIVVSLSFWLVTQYVDLPTKWHVLSSHAWLIACWFSLGAACLVAAWSLQGLDDYRSAVLVGARNGGALPNLAFLIFVCIGWKVGALDLKVVFAALVTFQSISLLLALWLIARRLRQLSPTHAQDVVSTETELAETDKSSFGPVWFLLEGWPVLATRLSVAAMFELDILWVGIYASEDDVANYGVAKFLVRMFAAPFLMLLPTLGPFVAELLGKNQRQRLEKILRSFASLVCLPSAAILVLGAGFPEWILAMSFRSDYLEAATILRILCIGQIVFVLSGNNGQTLTMAGKQKAVMVCSLLAFAGYVLVAPWLMSFHGVNGAALSVSLILIVQSIIVTLLAKRLVGVWTMPYLSPRAIWNALEMQLFKGRLQPRTLCESTSNDIKNSP